MEERNDKSRQEVNENLTMLLGQAWKQVELLRTLRVHVDNRFDRTDERITELNKDFGEQFMAVREIKADVMGIKGVQDEHGQMLIEHGKRFDGIDATLQEILARLPEKGEE